MQEDLDSPLVRLWAQKWSCPGALRTRGQGGGMDTQCCNAAAAGPIAAARTQISSSEMWRCISCVSLAEEWCPDVGTSTHLVSLSPGCIYPPGRPSSLSACLAGRPLHRPSPASSPCCRGAHCWHTCCIPAPSQQLLVKTPQNTWRALFLSSLVSYPTWKHRATASGSLAKRHLFFKGFRPSRGAFLSFKNLLLIFLKNFGIERILNLRFFQLFRIFQDGGNTYISQSITQKSQKYNILSVFL